MRRFRRFVCGVVPFLFLACGQGQRPQQDLAANHDEITEAEIASISAANAYEAIRKLRPNFLSFRGRTTLMGTSNPDPVVFVDDQRYGPISSLRTIPASQVTHIRLYRAWEAATKYGNGLMGGVIAVATKQ